MAGFTRRYGYFPGDETITQIEGIVIVDAPPPGTVNGVATGVACLVGEFPDMRHAVTVNGSGVVSTDIEVQQVFSGQDLIDKFGGFDETIGDFGNSEGNGFTALRNRAFSTLLVAAVNLASATGCRFWRELPVCTSATDALPVVPVTGGTIAAGREFRGPSGGRLRIATRVEFTALEVIYSGTGGSTTNAGAGAATQNFTVAGEDFSAVVRADGAVGIKKGDIVVLGYNNAGVFTPVASGGDLGAGTYRVAVDASSVTPTVLALEQMDGTNFDFVTAATISYRIHVSSDADSAPVYVVGATTPGGYKASEVGGYSVPVRPLTDEDGVLSDGTWTAASALTPREVPTAATSTSWDALSGLTGRVIPTGGVVYTAAVQAPNAASAAGIDVLYTAGLAATISDLDPVHGINLIWCARTSSTIRSQLKANVLAASAKQAGRMAVLRPALSTQTIATVLGDADPGVGANRNERDVYSWPGHRTYIPEAVGFRLKTADGLTTTEGILDVGADGLLISVMSNLPPERNPGQAAAPVPDLMTGVLGLQRGVTKLELDHYIALRSRGVCALRLDRTVGPVFQSGITTSLTAGEKNINRRRMADFIDDSLAETLKPYNKLPLSTANKDNARATVESFMAELLSENNPAQQRIKAYSVDDKSGNTPARSAKGIHVIITKVRTLPTGDFIVIQSEVGESVEVSSGT